MGEGVDKDGMMKVLVAVMSHETNTFSPVVTDLKRFEPTYGEDVLKQFKGTKTCAGAFLDVLEKNFDTDMLEVVTPIAGRAPPSSAVEEDAYEHMVKTIVDAAVAEKPDAIMLALHGAMVAQTFEDGEGELLRRLRAAVPNTPTAVSLDMHANFDVGIADNCDTVAGYMTYPHEDQYETAIRCGEALVKKIKGEAKPVTRWTRLPMIPHVMRQSTLEPYPGKPFKTPNKAIQERAAEMERDYEKCLCASVFVGFPHADISIAGMSVVVVTDDDEELAVKLRDELAAMCWAARADFVYNPEPLEESMARAKKLAVEKPADEKRPVVLLDHCDNTASGGTMDTTTVLAACIAAGFTDMAYYAIFDPAAIDAMFDAGEGEEVEVSLGGKLKHTIMPSEDTEPLVVRGKVVKLREANMGKGAYGQWGRDGRMATLQIGGIILCVVSKHVEPNNLAVFEKLDIDPYSYSYLVLKSRVHWQNSKGFGPVYYAVVECDGSGACTSDYSRCEFKNLTRPIYPLDAMEEADGVNAAVSG